MTAYHCPIRPYTPIDALNRRAAAVGSPGYAQAASHANYNGHGVSVSWNEYRRYYTAEYYWAGRMVLARGSFESCLRAALREYNRGALGASVSVGPREDDTEAVRLCEEAVADPASGLVAGEIPRGMSEWMTWRHDCAARSVRDSANRGMLVMMFDWELMQACETQEEYEACLKAKYGRVYG